VFSDVFISRSQKTNSVLLAGCDPVIETLPRFLRDDAAARASGEGEVVRRILDQFVEIFTAAIADKVPAIKPNIAFFEQYGLPGITSFARLCSLAKERGLLVIVDAKRGDIGSTAEAYARAYLGEDSALGFYADALTVNPFLGFDTLDPFIKVCVDRGKGIFVLVQTSNAGAKDIEGLRSDGLTVSERIADYLAEKAQLLQGMSGWSGVGAVVGATYPSDAEALRKRMPNNLFLIPGYGAQGGTAKDAVASFVSALPGSAQGSSSTTRKQGGLVNASRALLQGTAQTAEEYFQLIQANTDRLSRDLGLALEE
jgi:orotidine-5'-phosphate decarboxylase